jgi:hypothetical protein
MNQNSDVWLGYVGGCGGFFALHLLLLSNRYNCSLSQPFDQILQSQWNITHAHEWKNTEVWPDNTRTLEEFNSPRLLFECNPVVNNWKNVPSFKILIYADLFLHLKLSKYKNSFFYHRDADSNHRSLDVCFTSFYNNVRDPDWPDCTTIEQVKHLPRKILQELKQHEDFIKLINSDNWEDWFQIKHKKFQIDRHVVYEECFNLSRFSNHIINLKDIVRSQGTALLDPLGLTVTDEHVKFINMWVNLHPPELIKYLTND